MPRDKDAFLKMCGNHLQTREALKGRLKISLMDAVSSRCKLLEISAKGIAENFSILWRYRRAYEDLKYNAALDEANRIGGGQRKKLEKARRNVLSAVEGFNKETFEDYEREYQAMLTAYVEKESELIRNEDVLREMESQIPRDEQILARMDNFRLGEIERKRKLLGAHTVPEEIKALAEEAVEASAETIGKLLYTKYEKQYREVYENSLRDLMQCIEELTDSMPAKAQVVLKVLVEFDNSLWCDRQMKAFGLLMVGRVLYDIAANGLDRANVEEIKDRIERLVRSFEPVDRCKLVELIGNADIDFLRKVHGLSEEKFGIAAAFPALRGIERSKRTVVKQFITHFKVSSGHSTAAEADAG